jgi:predicted RNase H-like HicB family nuclease
MDAVEEAIADIETIYRDGGDREETLAKLERIKEAVDGYVEDLV